MIALVSLLTVAWLVWLTREARHDIHRDYLRDSERRRLEQRL